jgi:hypothetical protein
LLVIKGMQAQNSISSGGGLEPVSIMLMRHTPQAGKGNAMSEKPVKLTRTPLSPRPVVRKPDTVFLVPDDLDERKGRLTKAAAAAAAEPAPAPIPVPRSP